MKPIYELVTAAELRVGDTYKRVVQPSEATVESVRSALDGVIVFNLADWGVDHLDEARIVFRRLPATESPAVLRRALEIACEEIAAAQLMDSPAWAEAFANDRIQQARKEIESENTCERS